MTRRRISAAVALVAVLCIAAAVMHALTDRAEPTARGPEVPQIRPPAPARRVAPATPLQAIARATPTRVADDSKTTSSLGGRRVAIRKSRSPKPTGADRGTALNLDQVAAVLRDRSTPGRQAEFAISMLARTSRGSVAAADLLIEFARQPVDWNRWKDDRYEIDNQLFAKAHALDYLGAIGTPNAKAFLLRALTPAGAQAVAQPWFQDIPESRATREERVMGLVRGMAAQGLTYYAADDPAVQESVTREYSAERARVNAAGNGPSSYLGALCDAMARMDMIVDLGPDRFRELSNSGGPAYTQLMRQYMHQGGYTLGTGGYTGGTITIMPQGGR